jgi:hypothetical protein
MAACCGWTHFLYTRFSFWLVLSPGIGSWCCFYKLVVDYGSIEDGGEDG